MSLVPLPLVRVMTLYQLYLLYKDFETLYRAYTWVVYGYGLVKWVVGYRRRSPSREDPHFLVIDSEGGEVDLVETQEIEELKS